MVSCPRNILRASAARSRLRIRLQPPSEHPHDVAFLLLGQLSPALDAVPLRQPSSTAGRGCMLCDKDRMPAPRRLLAVIPGLTWSQPFLDELGCVHEDRVQSPSREIASVLVVERVPGTKRTLPEARKQLVYVSHTGILRDRCLGRDGARSESTSAAASHRTRRTPELTRRFRSGSGPAMRTRYSFLPTPSSAPLL